MLAQVRRLRLSRAGLVWIYVLALAAAAAAIFFRFAAGAEPLTTPHMDWWLIALAFVAAEVCVVHLEFRRSAHSFSLADIPFVFGLIFSSAQSLALGAVAGSAVVYASRRQPAVKLAFNCAQLWLVVSVAVIITRAIAPESGSGPLLWFGVVVAMLASGVLTILCIAGAIAISEGGMRFGTVRQMLSMDLLFTLSNTTIAVAAALVVATDVRALPLLAVPALTFFALYRGYVSERQRHEKLEFLYEANRTLSRSPEVAEALEGMLARSREAFRAEIAEVILFHRDGVPLRTTLGPGDERAVMQRVESSVAAELAALVADPNPVVSLTTPVATESLHSYLEARGVRHAMVAMLAGEERPIGTIMVANRFGLGRSFSPDDLKLLEALANNASVALQYDRLEQAVTQLRGLQEQLHHQAYHDPLTDLPNRSLFMERVRHELEAAGQQVAVLFIDVDDFKTVNDSLGHGVGDALLVSIAGRLRRCVRPEDVVARLGGDEFAVMLPGVSDPIGSGRRIATRIIQSLDLPVRAGENLLSVHASVGIASSVQADRDADQLIRNADVAMYQAKSKGKARFEVFESSMAEEILRRHGLKEELAKAVEREQIVVEYQPIVELDSGRIVATEALVRWEHPVHGLIPPAKFVPLAEETGLIAPIGHHVLRAACFQVRAWEDVHPSGLPPRVHVNLSVAELHDPGLVDRIRGAISDAGIAPANLVLEITETQLLGDPAASARRLELLREFGVRIALDDFGTGYSSLSYLHSLPLDILKVAKPFVDGLMGGGRESRFVVMIMDLARALGLQVIAEGIETAEQLDVLRELNTKFGQGYYLAPPRAPSETRLETALVG
jgi:diguanylate cyclase (GGDEF)-like protein